MRIGYFVTHYPYKCEYGDYFCGGVGEVAKNLAKEMAARGHEVFVFTTSRTDSGYTECEGTLRIIRCAHNFTIENAKISSSLLTKSLKYDLDIIHTHMGNAPAPIAALIYSKIKRKPLVTTYHGDQQSSYGSILRRLSVGLHNKCFAGSVLHSSDVITSPSEPFISESRFLGNFASKVHVIPNGINFDEINIPETREDCRAGLNIPNDKIVFLFVGSLSNYKGPDVLLEAIKLIYKKNKNIMLIYVGDGGMRDHLIHLSEDLGLDHVVRFAGFVSAEERNRYMKASDVFVLPSTLSTEVFPIVLLEASAFRLPIVVSDLKTFSCIIENGINGLMTKKSDAEDLAATLLRLSRDDDLRKELSKNASIRVKDFTWPKIADKFEKIYEALK